MILRRTIATLALLALAGACGCLYWQAEELRVQVAAAGDDRLAEQLAARTRQANDVTAQLDGAAAQLAALSNDVLEARGELAAEKLRHDPLRTQIESLVATERKVSARLEHLEQDAAGRVEAEVKATAMMTEIDTLKAQLQSLRSASAEAAKRAEGFSAERDALQAEQAKSDKRVDELTAEVDRLKRELAATAKQLSESRGDAAELRKKIPAPVAP